MKITLVVLFTFVAAAALGQMPSAVSSQAQMLVMPDHPQHADPHGLATEQSLVGGGSVTYAQGERPLWEFGPVTPLPAPLGDTARTFRKEKPAVRKAAFVFEKQGS